MKTKILFSLLLVFAIFGNRGLASAAEEAPKKVLILPFAIHSAEDLSYIRKGIQDMLATRLTREKITQAVFPDEAEETANEVPDGLDEKAAAKIGQMFGADYVVYGSLTVIGKGISTDAQLIDLTGEEDSVVFHATGDAEGDVISHIDRFADQISERVFGVKVEKRSREPQQAKVADSRRHPETIWREEMGIPPGEEEMTAPMEQSPIFETGAPLPSGSVWRSGDLSAHIIGMAAGDLTGDKTNGIVFIDEKSVYIYRYANGRLVKIEEVEVEGQADLISVDVADINENGRAEIFVTGVNRSARILRSFVLEWNGTRFSEIGREPRWYFRVIEKPGEGKILLGQRRGIKEIFMGAVHRLRWNGGEYLSAGELNLPRWISLYDFTYGDLLNNGTTQIIAMTENDTLRILDLSGEEKWSGDDTLGGSMVYLDIPDESASSIGDYRETRRRYISLRLRVADTDGDGRNELIVIKNQDTARRLFSKLRVFKSGMIIAFEWDKMGGVYQKWQTREIPSYISDFSLTDMDSDGDAELIFSVVRKTATFLGKAKSFVAALDLSQGKSSTP